MCWLAPTSLLLSDVVLHLRNAKTHEYKSVGSKKGNGTRAGWQNARSLVSFAGVMERRDARQERTMILRRRDFGAIQNFKLQRESRGERGRVVGGGGGDGRRR